MNHHFPSQFEYGEGLEWGFRPIAPPASGATFSNSLGGNRPREQFTGKCLMFVNNVFKKKLNLEGN
uniref:Bm12173 n=2 Tax=Brugia malayi TaxID=6279 RepID=A0A1I9GAZ1_BRUMA|nr:Bm12173 [Brugia malayi]